MAKRAEKPKPEQYGAFEELTRKLLNVPKVELDKKVRLYNAKKGKRKKPETT